MSIVGCSLHGFLSRWEANVLPLVKYGYIVMLTVWVCCGCSLLKFRWFDSAILFRNFSYKILGQAHKGTCTGMLIAFHKKINKNKEYLSIHEETNKNTSYEMMFKIPMQRCPRWFVWPVNLSA